MDTQKKQNRTWLVGASEGIGLALVKNLLQQNHLIIASARQAESHPQLIQLQKTYTAQLHLLNCDVTRSEELPSIAQQAWSKWNGLDQWIYNVGSYQPMHLHEWDLHKFEQMNHTNYLGAVHLMHALLPKFTAQKQGQWLWNISLASDFGLPYGGGYSAPKAALMNLAESLYPELNSAGIQLKVINHGFVKTRLTAKNDFAMLGLMEPEQAAQKIAQALHNRRFETRFPFSLSSILGLLKRLPKSWSFAITKRMLTDDK